MNIKQLFLFCFMAFVSAIIYSCSESSEPDNYFPYLDFNTEIEQSFLSPRECSIIFEAFERMNLRWECNILVADEVAAWQINVSDRLFSYLLSIIRNTNEYPYKPIPPTKADGHDYSCVSYALSHTECEYDFTTLDNWIRSQYNMGGAVPSNKIGEVLIHCWGEGSFWAYDSSSLSNITVWNSSTVGVIVTGGGWGHMINLTGVDELTGQYTYMDYSLDSVCTRLLPPESLVYVYQKNSVDTLVYDGLLLRNKF